MLKLFISGKQRAGKNVSATYINNKLSNTYPNLVIKEIAFADPINKVERYAQEVLDFPIEKDRAFRIMFGAWARDHNPKIFVEHAIKQANNYDAVIITDGRYVNEFHILKAHGFHTIRIVASEGVRLDRGADREFLNSTSEIDLDGYEADGRFDDTIINEGSFKDLYHQLDQVIGRLELKFLGGQ